MLRSIWAPSWHNRLNDKLTAAQEKATELGIHIGWIRYPSDGTRIQIFDGRGDRICKVHFDQTLPNTIPSEMEARARAGSIAPAILSVSSDQSAFVEDWVSGYAAPYSSELLAEVIKRLQRDVYAIEHINGIQYRDLLASYGSVITEYESLIDLALTAFSNDVLAVGQMHGDLVCQNVYYNHQRGVTLLDWEYSRRCIATYDCWLYFYDRQRAVRPADLPLPDEYYSGLDEILRSVGTHDSETTLSARHLLHLIERQLLLSTRAPGRTGWIRQVIKRDIYAEAQRLRRLMACDQASGAERASTSRAGGHEFLLQFTGG